MKSGSEEDNILIHTHTHIRNLTGVTTNTFKGHLDKWLKTVPDQPRGGGYSERVAAESNSIQHQAAMMRARR